MNPSALLYRGRNWSTESMNFSKVKGYLFKKNKKLQPPTWGGICFKDCTYMYSVFNNSFVLIYNHCLSPNKIPDEHLAHQVHIKIKNVECNYKYHIICVSYAECSAGKLAIRGN